MRHSPSRFEVTLYKEAGLDPMDALNRTGSGGTVTNNGTGGSTTKTKGKLSPLTIAALLLAGAGVGYGVRAYQDDRRRHYTGGHR